jgi:hypothetical protein
VHHGRFNTPLHSAVNGSKLNHSTWNPGPTAEGWPNLPQSVQGSTGSRNVLTACRNPEATNKASYSQAQPQAGPGSIATHAIPETTADRQAMHIHSQSKLNSKQQDPDHHPPDPHMDQQCNGKLNSAREQPQPLNPEPGPNC